MVRQARTGRSTERPPCHFVLKLHERKHRRTASRLAMLGPRLSAPYWRFRMDVNHTVSDLITAVGSTYQAISDLRAVVSLRGPTALVNEPFREHKTIADFAADAEGKIVSARGSAAFDGLSVVDYLRVRLTHPTLGGLRWDEGPAR